MSDGEYYFDGYLIDVVDEDWRSDVLPHENILIKPNQLPESDSDPEAFVNQRRFGSVPSGDWPNERWNELDLHGLIFRSYLAEYPHPPLPPLPPARPRYLH
ncbi:unnamed protein product [Protopolystoma xenopodis]|uniref:Anaphase-promoting complex subunit 13 n=1 Tax=Protopolystoma xenopodis TaxID=117903 RepID=A0A3S5AST1_9PLAT|nr:unnamed protein product [Protopolystoma xenopodis]